MSGEKLATTAGGDCSWVDYKVVVGVGEGNSCRLGVFGS
jgi:hypothetical protein